MKNVLKKKNAEDEPLWYKERKRKYIKVIHKKVLKLCFFFLSVGG